MIGAIAGDIVGSIYEWANIKTKEFELFSPEALFTDDSVLTVALADSILNDADYGAVMKSYYFRYPNSGYGGSFHQWAQSDQDSPYNSWGNGSAMRTSPVGYVCSSLEDTLNQAKHYASFTHNHPEGVKGAQATAAAIYLARTGEPKEGIRKYLTTTFDYDLTQTLDEIRPHYTFDVSCQGTVPPAIVAFLESDSFEDAVRNAISLGGDSDTLACITGGIAEAFYGGVTDRVYNNVMNRLDRELKEVVAEFQGKYMLQ